MQRKEAQLAREEKRLIKTLLESDYLLGVYDLHRIGALRFRTDPNGPFLDDNEEQAAPPWASLRSLEEASLGIENDDAEHNPNYKKWLRMLIAPGGSLGGARPKASIVDEKNHLWIAKFPSANDSNDIAVWEMVAYKLATSAKIIMPEAKVQQFNNQYHTFLTKRFDRNSNNERLHFASAMTLLGYSDGDGSTNASYLDIAQFIMEQGANPSFDLEQLWRRIIFYILISNTDDHLQNHGFLLTEKGWVLSPAFDINPVSYGDGLTLNISETDNSQDLSLALDVADNFSLKQVRAKQIMQDVKKSVSNWRDIASGFKITKLEQEKMENAFRLSR